jgi:putative sterol carrier protein
MHDAFSPDWTRAFADAVNADDGYAAAGAAWRDGVALVCTANGAAGFPQGAAVELDLADGRCHDARTPAVDAVTAPYVLSAPPATWRALLDGSLDAVGAVALGKVKLVRGSLGVLMMHSQGARALLACAARVPTRWPD